MRGFADAGRSVLASITVFASVCRRLIGVTVGDVAEAERHCSQGGEPDERNHAEQRSRKGQLVDDVMTALCGGSDRTEK